MPTPGRRWRDNICETRKSERDACQAPASVGASGAGDTRHPVLDRSLAALEPDQCVLVGALQRVLPIHWRGRDLRDADVRARLRRRHRRIRYLVHGRSDTLAVRLYHIHASTLTRTLTPNPRAQEHHGQARLFSGSIVK